MTVTARRPITLLGAQYRPGDTIPTETWDRVGMVHDRQRVLLSQHFVEVSENGGVAVAAPPAQATRKRGRPKGTKDKKPRKRRAH